MKAFFRINIIIGAVFFGVSAFAQTAHRHLLRGDDAYEEQHFEDAELHYRRALEDKPSVQGLYNLGNSTYRQERFDEAIRHFQGAAETAPDPDTRA